MKKILTRFASIFMAFAMILLVVPTMEANADQVTIKVHFKNTESWSSVYVYSWDSSGDIFGAWPGTDISATEDGGYYTATLPGYSGSSLNIIFGDGGSVQTLDLICDLTKSTEWWVVPSDNSTGKWACTVAANKADAENGKSDVVTPAGPEIPENPTVKESPVIEGNKVTFYFESTNANNVVISGEMNGWSTDWTMTKNGNVFSYTCELEADTYAYKYIVDGTWMTDPFNPITVQDTEGNTNSSFTVTATGGGSTVTPSVTSPVVEGGKVTFKYQDANATKVEVFGTMNEWDSGFEMTKDGDVFTYTMELPNGEYEYKFVVDGTSWINDLANSNQKNGNNVFTIIDGEDAPADPGYTPTITESLVIDGNKVTFYYESPTASSVELFGSMNGWETGYQMNKEGNVFSITLELEKGDYQYKFVIDGADWINDPLNANKDENGDSVFSTTFDAPVGGDTETPGTEAGTETGTETGSEVDTEIESEQNPSGDTPTTGEPMDGVIILISAIVIIIVGIGGFAVYLFFKRKKA